ncbi:hypothetical protein HYPSUDRAFT_54301 [Hypholoma sublateritium FD-334 SS-4]|uniref:Uncharacterized protein n=1 Tax=Hypholoma sublateritium (strain FD-334 SS-4) TaxID=945553 RepID=A0A0D2PVP1_HYPSF|nr:hypothetical protein HYPSUDRAFT_54301 [Hypholoma sublateritium FD-334 SS-4]
MKQPTSSRFRQLPPTSSLAQFLSLYDDSDHSGFITRLDRSPVSAKVLTAWSVQNMIIACAILVLLRSTSIPFFFGECRLRLVYGFRSSELIIRRSPPPTPTPTPSGFTGKGFYSSENQHMEHQWRAAIRAINPRLLYSTTSAMLSPDYWTLEYSAVFDAMRRIAAGEIREEDLEFSIWKQTPDNMWCACELWRMHEIMSDQQEVSMFKSFLTQFGKEDLLRTWEDMVPSEKGAKQALSPQSYQAMVMQFSKAGLDYDTVWSQISDCA